MKETAPEKAEWSEDQMDEVKEEEDLSGLGEGYASDDRIHLFHWKESKAPIHAVIRQNFHEILCKSIAFLEVLVVLMSSVVSAGCVKNGKASEIPWTKLATLLRRSRLTLVRWPHDCRMPYDPEQTTKKTFSGLQGKEKEMLADALERESGHALRPVRWDNSTYL